MGGGNSLFFIHTTNGQWQKKSPIIISYQMSVNESKTFLHLKIANSRGTHIAKWSQKTIAIWKNLKLKFYKQLLPLCVMFTHIHKYNESNQRLAKVHRGKAFDPCYCQVIVSVVILIKHPFSLFYIYIKYTCILTFYNQLW